MRPTREMLNQPIRHSRLTDDLLQQLNPSAEQISAQRARLPAAPTTTEEDIRAVQSQWLADLEAQLTTAPKATRPGRVVVRVIGAPDAESAMRPLPGVALFGGAEDGRTVFEDLGWREGVRGTRQRPEPPYGHGAKHAALHFIPVVGVPGCQSVELWQSILRHVTPDVPQDGEP